MIRYISILLTLFLSLTVSAQKTETEEIGGSPTFLPTMRVGKVLLDGDSVQYVEMNRIYCYPPKKFSSAKDRVRYTRLMRDVKRVLPIAKEVRMIMMETYEYLQTLPTKRERDEHLKLVEKGVKQQYTPKMKRLTLTQGKLLIKLVYRECHSSGYELINAFIGPLKAGFYQVFAWTFGASLKKTYEPETNAEDADIERIARLVESGQL
ncbi:MAG: DUF4294 domain-containing protein [Prevotella sp.]